MKLIAWVFGETALDAAERKAIDTLQKGLHKCGVSSQELGSISLASGKLETLAGLLPAKTEAVILAGADVVWCKAVLEALRRSQAPAAFVPAFFYGAETSATQDAHLVESGVSDKILPSDAVSAVLFRLTTRLRDAAERKRLDSERQAHSLRDAKNETILKQREEFLGVCAHDLRSPLGLIQSCLNMVLNTKGIETMVQPLHLELMNRAKRQAGQAITLVNDLLDVMSYEQGLKPQYQLLKLDDFLGEFHRDYQVRANEKQILFHYQNSVPEWRALFDADRIRQLLQNLVTNAFKYTPAGKNITLSVMPFQGRRKHDPKFPMITVSLKDEGKGIPAAELQKIFDKFTQVKDYARAEGRGLGLTVAKQISNLHDGNLWVESTEGKGATFFVLFPHVISRTTPEATAAETSTTVVVAEPNEHRREAHQAAFAAAGYSAHFVKDGIEALEQTYYQLPRATVLLGGLAKMGEEEVANILRGDALTSKVQLIFGSEAGRSPSKPEVAKLFHGMWKIPYTSEQIQTTLSSVPAERKKKSA